MAVKKSAAPKAKDGSASKAKAGGTKKSASAAKQEAAPPKSAAVAKKSAAPKGAAKKKAAPIKLTSSQTEILKKVGAASEPGYRLEKKAEQRTIDALLERKLIKKGAKDKASGTFHYQISSAGKKHAESTGGDAAPSAPSAGTP